MRKLTSYVLLVGLLFTAAGCDGGSNDDSSSTDVFFGVWGLGGISDGSGDRTAAFVQGFNSVGISFFRDGGFGLNVDSVDDELDASYDGEFTITESTKTLSVSILVNGQSFPLAFTYAIANDNRVSLTATGSTAVLLATLFSTTFAPPVTITLVKG